MGMLAVFCSNAINILAGINGVEAGQSLVIGISIAAFNCIQLSRAMVVQQHYFSLYLILPFIGVTAALLRYNWFVTHTQTRACDHNGTTSLQTLLVSPPATGTHHVYLWVIHFATLQE